jgi:hypothetical protein
LITIWIAWVQISKIQLSRSVMSSNPSPINNIANSAPRCQHRFANHKQCRLPASPESTLCPPHAKLAQSLAAEADYSQFLLKRSQAFQTAQGINHTLARLFELVAKNRISPRRAAVLTHIGGLLLRTHARIDYDRELDIVDPTKPKPVRPPIPDPDPTQKPS